MSTGLLFDCDAAVASWYYEGMGYPYYKYDHAVGLIDHPAGNLVGAVLFHYWNGQDVEISYYGYRTMTLGIIRALARFTLATFNPSRVTVKTSKRNKQLIRGLQKLGFKLEGMQRRYYGPQDINRNIAVRLVMFKEQGEVLAKINQEAA